MNTTPTLISPARTLDAKAGATREAGAAETPFSQVLSDEMAMQRNAQSGRAQADKSAAAEAPARSEPAAKAAAEAPAADTAPAQAAEAAAPADTAASDSLDPAQQPAVPDPADLLGLAAAPAAAVVLSRSGGPETGLDSAPAEDIAEALAQPLGAASRQGRSPQQRADAQAGNAAAAMRADPGVPGKAAAQPAAAAAEPAVQLAAARQPDAGSATTESRFDQILQPVLRAATPLHEAAARLGAEAAQPRLAPPVGSNAWGQALGDKIVWMTSSAQQTATLTLNPPNLGPLQVVLNISNDQAVANFFAAQPEVRQALESAFPRLKEMLNEAGVQLEQATVSADASPQQQQETASGRPGQRGPDLKDGPATHAGESPLPLPAQRAGRGLIDTFA